MYQNQPDYGVELFGFVTSFCIVQQDKKSGLWMAWLDPTHDFVREGKQPPGQINVYEPGDPTYTPTNRYTGTLPVRFVKGRPIWDADLLPPAERAEARAAWAARPRFRSAEKARRMIEAWIWHARPDIVRMGKEQALEAAAYRRSKGMR